MIFTIANRWRGTYGWFAKIFGLVIFVVTYLITRDWVVSLLFGGGYWLGELVAGWGDHIGNVTCDRRKVFEKFPDDGSDVGVRWLTSMIVYPELRNLHFENAKKAIWNLYPKTVNLEIKGWSIARLFKIKVEQKQLELFVIDKALTYSRVYLVVRGFYWWLLPMIGIGLLGSWVAAVIGLIVLSFGWIVCAELGFKYRDKISYEGFGLSFIGGWELQEGFYGLLQDIVFIAMMIVLIGA